MDYLWLAISSVGITLGLLAIPFGLPGVAVISSSISMYLILSGIRGGGWTFLAIMWMFTLLAETADNWLTALGARKFGASRGAVLISLLGGVLGGILLGPFLIPFLGLLGPLVAAFLGAFLVPACYEYCRARNFKAAWHAGLGAVMGRMAGILLKLLVGISIVVAFLVLLLRS
jgi:uncharacterized protein YqgC (DUF456 family)